MAMVWLLYYAFIYVMVAGIRFSSLWNPKSARWIDGRKDWRKSVETFAVKNNPRIWFHVSSLGEFEQARPVIEKIKRERPATEIILSFFSPSGFEIRKDYPFARVLYLPADVPGAARHWLDAIRPDLAVFVKYDLWAGYLKELNRKHIPFVLISAHVKPGTGFHSWSTPPVRGLLKKAKVIFLQKEKSLAPMRDKGFLHLRVAGDTRIDRAMQLTNDAAMQMPETLRNLGTFDLIAGSTWPADENILIPVMQQLRLRVIIAPHDIRASNIDRLIKSIPLATVKLSEIAQVKGDFQVLVVDNIGMLSMLYSLGDVAYVGGGFGKSIHNILEPVAHHKPVIFGPRYHDFPEAEELVDSGSAFVVRNSSELRETLSRLKGKNGEAAGQKAWQYLQKNAGATEIVTSYLLESIPYAIES